MKPIFNDYKMRLRAGFVSIMLISLVGGLVFGYVLSEVRNFSGIESLKKFQPSIPTKIYDVNGELIAELFHQKRDLVAYQDLPQPLINAFLATEDQSFYSHIGINPMAIVRAMLKNIAAGKVVQGGSTITQQLAKRLFTEGERTYTRKAVEAVLALQIEKKFTKQEILEMYFNQIYLGRGCYGISSAAKLFFDKDVKTLNVAESAVLAALPSAPEAYSPLMDTHAAYDKNRDILNRMVNMDFLTQERADEIYKTFWPEYVKKIKTEYPTKTAYTREVDKAPYFTDYVRQVLVSRFGGDVVYNQGLSVYTTLNLKRQRAGQKYLQTGIEKQDDVSAKANQYYSNAVDRGLFSAYSHLRTIFSLPSVLVKNDLETRFKKRMVDDLNDSLEVLSLVSGAPSVHRHVQTFREITSGISSTLSVEGALIAIEPQSGYITTLVGCSGFSVDNQFNRAIQARRQPGSAFKPYVYGAGIESRMINAGMALPDAPIMDIDGEGGSWSPDNYEGDYMGLVRVSKALAASINIISVRIFDIIGADRIIEYASRVLKVPETRFHPNPSLALGTTEVTPFEMATGYATYANRGREVIPFAIRYVVDRDGNELANIEEEVGNVIAAKEEDGSIQVIPEDVAYVMTSLMEGVVNSGTPTRTIRGEANFYQDCAGKTGTTSNWTDAWFCGYTPDIAAVVWVGYDKPFMSLGKHQAGASVAAPIWARYMKEIYNGMNESKFGPPPPGVYHGAVCAYSGCEPSEKCTEVVSELFVKGGGPRCKCSGEHMQMKSILERYMEKEGLVLEE
ncbi:MAG: penicillin-binding protein 1A [Spirochaetota bacterium]